MYAMIKEYYLSNDFAILLESEGQKFYLNVGSSSHGISVYEKYENLHIHIKTFVIGQHNFFHFHQTAIIVMMPQLSWWFIFMFLFVAKVYCRFENRILYGKVIDPEAFDWSVVQIRTVSVEGKTGLCTGTLISERHILTAMHCVQDKLREHKKFFINILHSNEWNGKVLWRSADIDIAILEYPKGTVFDKRAHRMHLSGDPMNDPYYQNLINNSAFVAGYGANNFYHDGAGVIDGKLRFAVVPIWPKGWCHGIKDKICTSDYSPIAVGGDSGGPLFFRSNFGYIGWYGEAYQIGVIIKGDTMSKYNLHTPILPNCDWIEKATNLEANCESIFKKPSERFRRSIFSPSSVLPPPLSNSMVIKNESKHNFEESNKDFDILISSENDAIILPLPDLPKNLLLEEENEEYKEMDAKDLYFILNFINICVLICLAIFLFYFSCCKTDNHGHHRGIAEQKV